MKRSPSSSCSSSSSSSCLGPEIPEQNRQPESQKPKPKPKRTRKTPKNPAGKCQNASTPNSGGGRRSSIYRGVTRHRWTGRFEAHLWDKSSWNSIQNKKGRQVYLGAYESEDAAAHTYDLAALKYWGPGTTLNFPLETYIKELDEMEKVTKEEYLASLRRQSSGFSRGVSKYRGVARHHHNGRWEARIGRVFGNKYLYLGTYNTQEEAAAAYDMAAIEYRGANAVTNFDISNYIDRTKRKIHLLNDQESEEPPAKCSNIRPPEEEEVEHKVQPLQPQQQQQQKEELERQGEEQEKVVSSDLQYQNHLHCIESNTMDQVMDSTDNHQFDWSFLDTGLMTQQLPVPNIPLDNKPLELPDLFDDMRFEEENFDLIFGAAGDANLDDLMESAGVPRNMEENGPFSSPSSTTTSVSL